MKSLFLLLLMTLSGLILVSCFTDREEVYPAGETTTEFYSFSDYHSINVSSAFKVYLTFSDTVESIAITSNENVHQYIVVRKENNRLIIGLENHVALRGNAVLNAYITTRNVTEYEVSGASRIYIQNSLKGEEITIDLSGASQVSGEIEVDRLELSSSGASSVSLTGSCITLNAELSGASTLGEFELVTDFLDINLSGASRAYLTVNETVDIDASGASALHFKGSADIRHAELSGASDVSRED